MGRILSVWSPNWPITTWRRKNPGCCAPGEPFALVETEKNARRLRAVDETALAQGLRPGQKLTDALAVHPGLRTFPAEPEAEGRALDALSDWCVRFSPAVALDPPDGLFLEVSGSARLWASEQRLLDDFLGRLQASGLPARGAIADTAGCAWALARYGSGREVVASGRQAQAIAPLPVAALRLEPEAEAGLRRLGLKRIEQLTALPRPQLSRRFGQALLLRLDQTNGTIEEALTFRRPPRPWFERLAFAEPISAPDDLKRAALDAAQLICARLVEAGRGARRFELTFHRVNATATPVRVGTSLPACDPVRLAKLFEPKLEAIDPGFGIEVVTVTAERVQAITASQAGLIAGLGVDAGEGVADLVDRLGARLGETRVWRADVLESWVPERTVRKTAPFGPRSPGRWDPSRPRPIRLFRRPEPIEATALVPDDPPVLFRWRGRTHRVRAAEGPERIAQEWWRKAAGEQGPARVRDYYRVEDSEGGRFWIFRVGLYTPDAPARWFVHGLFG